MNSPQTEAMGHNYHIVPELPKEFSPWNANRVSNEFQFTPRQPKSLADTRLSENDLLPNILKYLYVRGVQTGNNIANQLRLPFGIVEPLLSELRSRMLITYRGSAVGGDYEYELTPSGLDQAQKFYNSCTYCGAAPVDFEHYFESVYAQSLRNIKPTSKDIKAAMSDLVISPALLARIGQAIRSGKSMLLYGAPGNGKSSIARRIIRAMDSTIWIPRTLTISGSIIRLFDASIHEVAPMPKSESILTNDIDDRWVRIKRPVVVVGGELSMKHLDATLNETSGIIEAPIHLKSNCGCLVVDDFGRQRITTEELLNRWIIPLESSQDYLSLPTGRQIRTPFEQLVTFSTNLQPQALCDEAFLRRIHYKIEVFDPTQEQFELLWNQKASEFGFQSEEGAFEYLVETHYKQQNRSWRFCHPADLLLQIKHFCEYQEQPLYITPETIDVAIANYFATM